MEKPQKRLLQAEIEHDVQEIEKEIAGHPELEQVHVTEEMDAAFFAKIRAYKEEKAKSASAADRAEDSAKNKEKYSTEGRAEDSVEGRAAYSTESKVEGRTNVEMAEELFPDMENIRQSCSQASEANDRETVGYGPASEANDREMLFGSDPARGANNREILFSSPAGDKNARGTVSSTKRPARSGKRRLRWIVVVAAVLVLVMGLGMTSVGSKSYWKELFDILIGKESAKVIDVEDMEKQETEDINEIFVYQEIDKKLGSTPVVLRYTPKKMKLERYEIDEDFQLARVFWKYQDDIVRYSVYAGQQDSSWTEKDEDKITDEYTIEKDGIEIKVTEYQKPNKTGIRRTARFEYQGMHYELQGILDQKEFEKILENLYFL